MHKRIRNIIFGIWIFVFILVGIRAKIDAIAEERFTGLVAEEEEKKPRK